MVFFLVASLWAAPTAAPLCKDPANRFRADVFNSYDQISAVQFGSNKNPLFSDRVENFLADIFKPSGDACALRPLIIFIHGGWFQNGGYQQDDGICQRFAKMGFVAATIEYRKGLANVFTPSNFGTPAFMATQDARAAVRFFRKNAAQYGIDTSLIFVGGCSAGGYAALLTTYMDKLKEIPSFIDTGAVGGGIEGNSGNPGYDWRYAGAINISGGLFDTNSIEPKDKPVVSVQCQGDPIVHPGGDSLRNPNTGKGFVFTYGSTAVHARATHLGVPNALFTFQRSCHCAYLESTASMDTTVQFIGKSLFTFMTSATTSISTRPALKGRNAKAASSLEDPTLVDIEGRKPKAHYPDVYLIPSKSSK